MTEHGQRKDDAHPIEALSCSKNEMRAVPCSVFQLVVTLAATRVD